MPFVPTLVLSTLVSCMDEVDKLYFKYKTGVKPSVGEAVNKVPPC